MSVSFESTSLERVMDMRKRRLSDEPASADPKRPRFSLFLRLESESSIDSHDDVESVYSIQGKETDLARDTSDEESDIATTDIDSDTGSETGELVTLEYDVASLSGHEEDFPDYTSSGTEDLNIQAAAEGAFAAVLLDSSMESWADTDIDGGTSSEGSTIFDAFDYVDVRKEFWACLQCKATKDNPLVPYCEKCFQSCWQCKTKKTFRGFPLCIGCYKVRKTFFPPRPKPSRKRKHHDESKLMKDTVQNYFDARKSNASSSQGGSPASGSDHEQLIAKINFEKIVVPNGRVAKRAATVDCASGTSSTMSHDVSALSDSDIFNAEDEEVDDEPPRKRKRVASKPSCSASTEAVGSSQDSGLQSQEFTDSQASCASTSSPSTAAVQSDHAEDTEVAQHSDAKSDSDVSSGKTSITTSVAGGGGSGAAVGEMMCMMCTTAPKNGIFLHGSIGHMCCCYKCAMRVWRNCKRCPICNCKVKNVVKLFTT